jgi:hypothetical protein
MHARLKKIELPKEKRSSKSTVTTAERWLAFAQDAAGNITHPESIHMHLLFRMEFRQIGHGACRTCRTIGRCGHAISEIEVIGFHRSVPMDKTRWTTVCARNLKPYLKRQPGLVRRILDKPCHFSGQLIFAEHLSEVGSPLRRGGRIWPSNWTDVM